MARILIIDDDAALCSVLERMLRRIGHVPFIAYSLEEGLAQGLIARPDIVLLDVRLPDANGITSIGCPQRRRSLSSPVPAIPTVRSWQSKAVPGITWRSLRRSKRSPCR